jgi:serine/threonine protein kinase
MQNSVEDAWRIAMSPHQTGFANGQIVAHYRIIGAGSDRQYRAVHVMTGARVILDVRSAEDWRLVSVQFVRAHARLETVVHPGIAAIVGHGVLADQRPWVASEHVDGPSLGDLLTRRKMPIAEAAQFVRDVAQVLAFVHQHDIVHGNLRPSQMVFASGPGRQFPICIGGWSSLRAPGIPTFGDPPATNVYVAPEHLHGAIDGRADVYTLGAIAYRAVTGVFHDVERDLLLGGFGGMIAAMLERDPACRPTAADVSDVCDGFVAQIGRDTAPNGTRPRWTPAPGQLVSPPRELPPPLRKRRT